MKCSEEVANIVIIKLCKRLLISAWRHTLHFTSLHFHEKRLTQKTSQRFFSNACFNSDIENTALIISHQTHTTIVYCTMFMYLEVIHKGLHYLLEKQIYKCMDSVINYYRKKGRQRPILLLVIIGNKLLRILLYDRGIGQSINGG